MFCPQDRNIHLLERRALFYPLIDFDAGGEGK